jgi:hypothetical protein
VRRNRLLDGRRVPELPALQRQRHRAEVMKRPTAAQRELLALLRQGWLIRREGYMVGPQRQTTGGISWPTVKACHKAGWLTWAGNGWTISDTAP